MSVDEDLKLVCLVMWREARGEGLEGMRAVSHVIKNRSLAWKQTWEQVIMAPNQFSSMTHPGDSQLNLYPDYNSDSYKAIADLAEQVYTGVDTDNTDGALYYANLATMNSPWFQHHIVDQMEQVAVIGHHTFFRPA